MQQCLLIHNYIWGDILKKKTASAILIVMTSLLAGCPTTGTHGIISVQQGNIVYSDPKGTTEVLTETGADDEPVLSPDGTLVAFTRLIRDADDAHFDPAIRDLWVIQVMDHKVLRLVRGRPEGNEQPEQVLADICHPVFSPDGDTLYFMTAAWATSSAIHAVSVAGGTQRFVAGGNSLAVVSHGKYKNALLANQHRYMDGGGSWNPAVLVSPSGTIIKVVGEGQDALQNVEAEH
jgi:Tol biopolymer transport system component